jgi:hypothetical protein
MLLRGTVISAPTCGDVGETARTMGIAMVRPRPAGDFVFAGAWVENDALQAGNRNTVRVEFTGVTGSGSQNNQYAHAGGPSGPVPRQLQGIGNRLEIVGDPGTFGRLNHRIDPPPPPEFFSRTSLGGRPPSRP